MVLLIGDTFVQNKESYAGLWPVNINKDEIRLESKTNNFECPNGIGCECSNNDECYNNNCKKHFRGKYCTLQEGDIFPEFVAIDQFGEYEDHKGKKKMGVWQDGKFLYEQKEDDF